MTKVAMRARHGGSCRGCDEPVRVGDAIVYLPPKGKRRRGLVFHEGCSTTKRSTAKYPIVRRVAGHEVTQVAANRFEGRYVG